MTQNVLSFNPPRLINEPVQPLPQTVCATLEHSGIPTSALENITDIPPSLDWMASLFLYKTMFRFNATDAPGAVLATYNLPSHLFTTAGTNSDGKLPAGGLIPWNYVPFMGSKWWTGQVTYKFIAIKPPKCAGRLIIRYAFSPDYDFAAADKYRRCPAMEWDLSLSSEFQFDVNGVCPLEARPTWVPEIQASDKPAGNDVIWVSQVMPYPSWSMGKISIECAQRYVPGSIFPDSTRILVFMSYKNADFFMPTDFRSDMGISLVKEKSQINAIPT